MSGTIAAAPARNLEVARALSARRSRQNTLVKGFCILSTLVGIVFLASILATLLWLGLPGLTLHVFANAVNTDAAVSGLGHAIVGSLIQTGIGTAIGAPVGMLAGTYLAEYAGNSALGNTVRFISDMLLSAPSILIGLFIYTLMVVPFGGSSALAGSVALAVIVVPVVLRSTEDQLRLIPTAMREAAVALGAPKWKMVTLVCYRAAREGIMTGILLAVARIAGETAPLLFTSFGNTNFSFKLNEAMASLPLAINSYANAPDPAFVRLAWTGALLVTASVLCMNILARTLLRARK
jgi:phosphate transport system permease protein